MQLRLLLLSIVAMASLVEPAPVPDKIMEIVKRYAPIFWLHPEEVYFPSTVEYHMENCELRDEEERVLEADVTVSNIVTGEDSKPLHLNTKEPLPYPQYGDLELFKGQPLDQAPVYTFVRPISMDPVEMEIQYRIFFPYNRGKDICVGFYNDDGECVGYGDSFGHHVSDWEGVIIYVKDDKISDIFISVHSFGANYGWNETKKQYDMYYGEDVGTSLLPFDCVDPEYPQTVQLEGERPVIYAANGSHGMWAAEGKHNYCEVIRLYDETGKGYKFESKDHLKVYVWGEENSSDEDEWRWLQYLGRWGNLEQGCQLEFIAGECNLNNGVGGPTSPPNHFPVNIPDNYVLGKHVVDRKEKDLKM